MNCKISGIVVSVSLSHPFRCWCGVSSGQNLNYPRRICLAAVVKTAGRLKSYMNLGMRLNTLTYLILLTASLALPTRSIAASALDGPYRVVAQWPLMGEGGWNHMVDDPVAHLLYIPRDNRVTVLDTHTGAIVGEIDGMIDVRAIALDSAGLQGFISDGVTGAVHVFDRSTLKLVSSIMIGGTVEAIVFEPVTKTLIVFDTHNATAAIVDTSSFRKTATIPLPGRPATAVVDGKGSVFVNLSSTGKLAHIDAKSLKLAAVWSLLPCVGPSGLAIDVAHERAFSVCENKQMVVSDISTGKVVAEVAVSEGAKAAGFDSSRYLVFASSGEGALTVIREDAPDRFSVQQTVSTQPGTRTMAVDSLANRVYMVSAKFGQRSGPTSEELQFRPTPIAGTVVVLVVGDEK
jgi:hypothetical protein